MAYDSKYRSEYTEEYDQLFEQYDRVYKGWQATGCRHEMDIENLVWTAFFVGCGTFATTHDLTMAFVAWFVSPLVYGLLIHPFTKTARLERKRTANRENLRKTLDELEQKRDQMILEGRVFKDAEANKRNRAQFLANNPKIAAELEAKAKAQPVTEPRPVEVSVGWLLTFVTMLVAGIMGVLVAHTCSEAIGPHLTVIAGIAGFVGIWGTVLMLIATIGQHHTAN